jgi:hypothetical protein
MRWTQVTLIVSASGKGVPSAAYAGVMSLRWHGGSAAAHPLNPSPKLIQRTLRKRIGFHLSFGASAFEDIQHGRDRRKERGQRP